MTTAQAQQESTLLLAGLDGGNLLAFLAALGTLRILGESAGRDIRISWAPSGGTWRPSLHLSPAMTQEQVVEALAKSLGANDHPSLVWNQWEKATAPRQELFTKARIAGSASNRLACDWLCAIGSDLPGSENEAADTPLRVPRTDYLLGNIKTILTETQPSHLREALFLPWTYSDPLDNCSLKFEPSEDRRHAFQWDSPSGDPTRKRSGNVLGANRLALEALPLFPCVPAPKRMATVGCIRAGAAWNITWSLWGDPLSMDVVRSILAYDPSGQKIALLRDRGVVAVFQCQRLTIGKTRIFSPARRLA